MNSWCRLAGRFFSRFCSTRASRRPTFRPMLQELEDRCVPAVVTEFTGLTAGSQPTGIVQGADGNLWFTEFSNNALGRITPAGVLTEFPLAPLSARNGPTDILSDAHNYLPSTPELTTGRTRSSTPLA